MLLIKLWRRRVHLIRHRGDLQTYLPKYPKVPAMSLVVKPKNPKLKIKLKLNRNPAKTSRTTM